MLRTLPPVARRFLVFMLVAALSLFGVCRADEIRDLQTAAMKQGVASWGSWGPNPNKYSTWKNHSNRLTPIYTFGITLDGMKDGASVYRNAERLREIYGRLPEGTLNPDARYLDQTDVYRLQQRAVEAGKKYVVLVIFDGMDWQTTWAAAIYKSNKVAYREGRGTGLHIQDYRGVKTDYGYLVSSPHNAGTKANVDSQTITNPGGTTLGGFDASKANPVPWLQPHDPVYLLGKNRVRPHAVTDSASSATSMTSGLKTYNAAINVDPLGRQVVPIARDLQRIQGWSVGIVTNVPISHATPASAYANNVHRGDYQDLTRDLVGLKSVSHPASPLPGVDVLLGCGWGNHRAPDAIQGANYVAGNRFLSKDDLAKIDTRNGGAYELALRTPKQNGREVLQQAAERTAEKQKRLFGFFGVPSGHLPFQTADGDYDPTFDYKKRERYSAADIEENPTLADMTQAALTVLETNKKGFWLMVEAGDVDWANHANNIDNSIGAVLSGDDAFRTVTRWVDKKKFWDETVVIVTSDHGHYFELYEPERIAAGKRDDASQREKPDR